MWPAYSMVSIYYDMIAGVRYNPSVDQVLFSVFSIRNPFLLLTTGS